ncbi:MAG: IS4 family transposase, partial [Cyanothece sp. SIO1E1]|nr:IS4 family transposase [Cyanothece sp. SIO1E1]
QEVPSSDTGAYSKARGRLPESVLKGLLSKTSQNLDVQAEDEQLWCGRRVRICDGSSVLMSDTPANQDAYPQHSNQKTGCGFPIAKIVVMFSLTTGALMSGLIEAFNVSELVMARQLYRTLSPGDVALADQAFGTYVDLVLVQSVGADAVFRKHHQRKSDFRRGKKLGNGDHVVTWHKPQRRPRHMSAQEFEALPASVQVREVRLLVHQPGFRTKAITVVTTLLDPKGYPRPQLAELYRLRWYAEINLKHVKTTLGMEKVGAKTPAMVRKEIWMHLMAYNLLRTLMWQAAQSAQVAPLSISLQGTRQLLLNSLADLATATPRKLKRLYRNLLAMITHKLVPHRPNRVEPRAKKQRPKAYPRMQQPRSVLKANLAA